MPSRVDADQTHYVKVVLHREEGDEGGDHLLDGESPQGVLVAHDEELTHLDHRLQLLALIPAGLEPRQQLVGFATWK